MAGQYKLDWDYCECGCKGSTCGNLWMHDTLRGVWILQEGHGMLGRSLGRFSSIEEMEEKAIEYIRKEVKKRKTELAFLEKQLPPEPIKTNEMHQHRNEV